MNSIKTLFFFIIPLGLAWSLMPESSVFIKKKKNGPSVTECADLSADFLDLTAQAVAQLGEVQKKMIQLSREMIENDKACYLLKADKEQLKQYHEHTQRCKDAVQQAHDHLAAYQKFLQSLS